MEPKLPTNAMWKSWVYKFGGSAMYVGSITVQKNHYIQSLRGYAAILVVVDHALLRLAGFGMLSKRIESVANDMGAMGVHVFFVISGFIMMYTAFDGFNRPGASRRFIVARITRIVPLYYVATGVTIAIGALYIPYCWSDIAFSMAFMPSHVHLGSTEYLYPVLGVGWTLNYEMFFYLLFAFALLFARRSGVIYLVGTLLFLIAMGGGLRILARHPIGTEILFDIFYYFTRDIMLYFVFGILIAIVARRGTFPSVAIPMPALWGCGLGILEICLCNYLLSNQFLALKTALTMMVAIVSVAFCVVAIPGQQKGISEKLGDASYSIYLFHGFFLSATVTLWQRWVGAFYLGEMLSAVLVGIGGGYLTHVCIERPLNILVHRKPIKRPCTVETDFVSVEPA